MTTMSKGSKNRLGMPIISFGTFQLSDDQARESVKKAIDLGYRSIDTAESYGNEKGVGEAIAASSVSRDDLFITTKLFPGSTDLNIAEKKYKDTINTLKDQLKRLKLDYVDLYLIHAPISPFRLDQWAGLVELKKKGLARHIGVSNYKREEILDIGMESPEADQIEFHPLNTQASTNVFLKSIGMTRIAYSSLAPLSAWRREKVQEDFTSQYKKNAQALISGLSKTLKVTPAKLLLRWGLQHGYSILAKSTKEIRMRENINLFDFSISKEDMDRLDSLNQDRVIAWASSGVDPMSAPKLIKNK